MKYKIEPLGNWTDAVTEDRASGRFRAPWKSTLALLGTETEYLGATLVVLQVDTTRGEIRLDGMLRANAKVDFPGVRVSFGSDLGALTYSTDRFAGWQENIRAIALALVALRAVDRYGVGGRGEQYTGWLALAAPPPDFAAARDLLDSYGGEKAAVKATHPDFGGDPEKFDAVNKARKLLASAGVRS